MRKRRVLALLLALSLVVSGNGMTVLAAEQGAEMPVSQEEIKPEKTTETGEQEEKPSDGKEAEQPDQGETSGGEENKIPVEGEDKTPTEGENPENGEKPAESGSEEPKDEDGEQGGDKIPVEDEKSEEPEKPETPTEQEPAEQTPVEEPEKEAEPEEPEVMIPEAKPYVSRMVTFTDDIGMHVTYDANASTQYIYKITDGVLTDVVTEKEKVDEKGEPIVGEDGKPEMVEEKVAFQGNVELKQPEEGEPYTSIAAGVFGGNTDITYVKLPAGVTTVAADSFKGCTNLKSVYLPSTVNKIEAGAFEGCTAMTQIAVPKAVTAIGDNAFRGDARLHLVYIKDVDYSELVTIGAGAFEGCAVLSEFCADTHFAIPNKVKSIGASAFKGCKAIRTVDFKDTKLEELGISAFEGCTKLESLSMGTKLSLISKRAFADCGALASVTFPVVGDVNCTIDEYAFSGCYNVKQLFLPQFVNRVNANAFQNCTKLTRVEIRCDIIELVKESFPLENNGLVIVATPGSKGDDYAAKYAKRADKEQLYTYRVEDIDGNPREGGKFPGGTLWVGTADKNKYEENINTLNKGKGVKSDATKYYVYQTTKEGYTFIADSLKCNGQPMRRENGKYYFTMPEGGAVITAEFRENTLDKIKGQKVAVEFSAGVPLQNGKQDDYGYLGVELKLGQTTRLFVLDEDGEAIPASKLELNSQKKEVVTIDSRGIITATGTGSGESASAAIEIRVVGGDGKEIVFTRTINVRTAEAKSIILKASGYRESQVDMDTRESGIQIASINKNFVKANDLKFTLKASVYDGEDAIGKKLQWTSSDSRVAALASSSTEAKNPSNEVVVKKNCEGEATITVTANNAEGAEKDKIVQKFVIRVYQEGYRLANSSVTINPIETNGGTVELLSTSGMGIGDASIKLYEEESTSNTRFTVTEAEQTGRSESSYKKFYIKPDTSNIKNGTYKVRVGVNGARNEDDFLPLTITVKRTVPTPTIKFNSKKTKFNLFYKNGGYDADGNQTVVTTEITKLGDAKIEKVALEPLTQKEDDRLFTENFEVDNMLSDLSEGKVIIRRKAGNLKYTSQKKAAVTGYLTIYYEGFEDSAAKKMKVTMPTCSTAPSYALRVTKATYRLGCGTQEELLELYDKKSKTKEKVVLDEEYTVTEEQQDIVLNKDPEIKDGAIALNFQPEKGKFKLVLRNKNWDLDKNGKERTCNLTYTVNVSSAKPTVKADKSTVSLNLNYPEAEAAFTLTSNQRGLNIEENQTFLPVATKSNAGEIGKLEVTYKNGEGKVKITDKSLRTGTYKFECNPQADWPDLKKATLAIKVVNTKPTVKLGKGSMQLNLAAFKNNNNAVVSVEDPTLRYGELAQRSFKVSGIPDGYTLADVGTGSQNTTVTCKSRPGLESQFDFRVTPADSEKKIDNILSVSLKSGSVTKGTYSFIVTPAYQKEGMTTVYAKPVTVSVKVYSSDDISLALKASGKINLLNREGEANTKNGIIYTPSLKNLKGDITDVRIYDGGSLEKESDYFDIEMITEGKNEGKFYVTPKKTVKKPEVPETPGTENMPEVQTAEQPVEYEYAALEYNKSYPVRIWVKVNGYAGKSADKNGVVSKTIQIKASQVLPKPTLNKTALDVYLSTKDYDATFTVTPKKGSVGAVEKVYFGEKDEKALESFELIQEMQKDGSLKVIVHLKEGVEYPNGSENDVKMYVKYKGQGEKTPETATAFTMKIKVN